LRLFITGLAGYLGARMAHEARGRGWDVGGSVHRAPAAGGVPVDVCDAAAVSSAIDAARPDVVVHTAYRQGGAGAAMVTVGGSYNVASAARAAGARLVHLSTDLVFSGRLGRPLTEDDTADPVNDYGRHKACAESVVLDVDPRAVVVRTSLLYGGASHPGPQERMAADPGVTFFTDELRCPIEVGAMARDVLDLALLDVSGVLHVAGPEGLDRLAFARRLALELGRDPAAVRGAPGPPDRPKDCRLDSSRAWGLLGR
jgi:dTDP-4-dehydrorhamnose reductase